MECEAVVSARIFFIVSGLPKPVSVEQKILFGMVLGFVQKFLPDFAATDITWVRSMKSSKFAVLNVQCRDVTIATRVKSTFAALVKSANKPAYIGDVSISFAHTLGTRVRISLMRAMSKRQKEKDPNATCSVSAFTARPLLRVGGKDQGTRFLSFVDAIAGFRHLLTQEDLDRALSLCTGQKGKLKSKFLVLSDDRTLPPYQGPKKRAGQPGRQAAAQSQAAPMPGPDHISVDQDLQQPPPQLPGFRFAGQQFPMYAPLPGHRGLHVQQQVVPGVMPIQSTHQHALPHFVFPGQGLHPVHGLVAQTAPPSQVVQVQTVPQVASPNLQAVQSVQGALPVNTQSNSVQLVSAIQSAMQQVTSQVPSPGPQQIPLNGQVGVATTSNQVLVRADVHQLSAGLNEVPFTKVTRKRVRKPALPPSVKRLTPLRKVKVEQKKPKVADVLNKSENQEEFASCPSGSEEDADADITEIVLGNPF